MPAANVTPVKTGVHPLSPRIWIPFFNGMTDAVRHLDSGRRRNDERKSRLLVDEFRTPRLGAEGHSVCHESAISLRPLHLARMEADDGFRLSSPTAPEFLVGVAAVRAMSIREFTASLMILPRALFGVSALSVKSATRCADCEV